MPESKKRTTKKPEVKTDSPLENERLEQQAQLQEALAGMPELKPAAQLWGSQRAIPQAFAARIDSLMDGKSTADWGQALLLAGEIIDWLATVAASKAQFVEWAKNLSVDDQVSAAFAAVTKVVVELGE
jgi:transposase